MVLVQVKKLHNYLTNYVFTNNNSTKYYNYRN